MSDSTGSDVTVQRSGPFAALLGWVVGTALQLQQGVLWPVWGYLASATPAALVDGWLGRHQMGDWPQGRRTLVWLLCAAALTDAGTGVRSLVFDAQALEPALEGRDLRVVVVVTHMPQRNEAGLRFILATDSATLDGRMVPVPSSMDVGWHSSGFGGCPLPSGEPVGSERQPGEVRASAGA